MDVKDLIGIPYKARGRDKDGLDCYGLFLEIMRREGVTGLPDPVYPTADTEREMDKRILESLESAIPNVRLDAPEIGCVIEFTVGGDPAHIGVYLGEGAFIHSSRTHGVCVDKLFRWGKRIKGYYRVIEGKS